MSIVAPRAYDVAAVVVPARNERAKLPACLRAVLTAALCAPIPVTIVVVLDGCDDGSDELAGQYGPDVHFISVDAHNVGTARAVGFGYARSLLGDDARSWFATTDADSEVDPGWLVRQLSADADMVLGVVRVTDWRHHTAEVIGRYLRYYQANPAGEHDGHEHIHGANMGFSAKAYRHVGGFRNLPTGEDVDLVERFGSMGYRIRRDTELSVITSARTQARAPRGFAHHLEQMGRTAAGDCV